MDSLSSLEPARVWKHFENICAIPHPSKHEEKILQYIRKFADKHSLAYEQDKIGNIIIYKPAKKGYEACKTIALQAHVDMVPQKNQYTKHNFIIDPIIPIIDGEWIRAKHTTLGADNGIGVAVILAILESHDIQHGSLEALFTVDEEAGMGGANALSPHVLKAQYMINTDTEDEHDITIGCAGGIDGNFVFSIEHSSAKSEAQAFKISISGLTGGHSGFEIHHGRANANVLLSSFLHIVFAKFAAEISFIQGGNMRNAIPRESEAVFTIPFLYVPDFKDAVKHFIAGAKIAYYQTDPNLTISITDAEMPETVIQKQDMHAIITALNTCINGVISVEDFDSTITKTSNNLSIIQTHTKYIEINCLLRSSSSSEKMKLAHALRQHFSLYGAQCDFSGDYPGWEPVWESKIVSLVQQAYARNTQIQPHVTVVHAGLECGIIKSKYPHMEFVSFGPNIRGPHSPDERVEIASVAQFWNILLYVLKHAASL